MFAVVLFPSPPLPSPPPYETRYKYLSESKPGTGYGKERYNEQSHKVSRSNLNFKKIAIVIDGFFRFPFVVERKKLAACSSRCEQLAPLSRLETTCYKIFAIILSRERGEERRGGRLWIVFGSFFSRSVEKSSIAPEPPSFPPPFLRFFSMAERSWAKVTHKLHAPRRFNFPS